ncbi:hypothetical protein AACH06_28520 [Ideonella sp. DXS29W]|uniref:SMP-30/Gluconolactonase/LRE-like region domain-containing protein n=1 Tax=Ideonella lacteola TaxID=2984193 RepID=A0ABU9BXS1_9BURK
MGKTISHLTWASVVLACSVPAWADRVKPVETTDWGHPFGDHNTTIRGLAFDGQRYYVADALDHFIDKRPRDNTGRIYIYDLEGHLIKRIPEVPPVKHTFFPHGVATDGKHLWTTDYFGNHIYEYDIDSGALLRTMASPVSSPVRIDYQKSTRTLWMAGYGNPAVTQVDLDGQVVSSITTSGFGPNLLPAVDGRGDLWVSGPIGLDNPAPFKRYADGGAVLQTYEPVAWSSLATDIHNRSGGFVVDLKPVFNASLNRWESRFRRYDVDTVGGRTPGLSGASVRCENQRTAQAVTAHAGAPAQWNCEDGGLAVQAGDPIRIELTGTVR